MKKSIRSGLAVAATAILLSGCAGGDVAGDARRDAEKSVSIGIDHLAKGLADSISSDSIGAQLTADAISRMGVPMLSDPDLPPSASPAPYTPGVGTAVLLGTSGTGQATRFTFWIYQDVSTSASFVSLSVQVYGCGEMVIERSRAVRLHDVPCPSWAAPWGSGQAKRLSLEAVLTDYRGGTAW